MFPARARSLILLIILALLATSCANNLSIKTNPVGAVAYYGAEVTAAVQGVQSLVIEAEKNQWLSTDTTRAIVLRTRELGLRAQDLAAALTELEEAGIDSLARRPLLGKIGIILKAMNGILFEVIKIPIGDAVTADRVSTALRMVSDLLITVAGEVGRV